MSKVDDETIPDSYRYHWTPKSDVPLKDFLTKFRPSMVENDGTKPWIWVQGAESKVVPDHHTGEIAAIEEASKLLEEVTARIEEIKNDASIPLRSNKKTGAKSKKEVREQVQAEAVAKLKEIALKHKYVVGKWLIFAPHDKVDSIWSSLATSLVEGPIAETKAFLAKVATSHPGDNPNQQHVICLYIPDVYDKDSATSIMRVLLRSHGFSLSGVKSDLFTLIGIDSKHPSGIPSTIWKNSALMKDSEIKELREAHFAELNSKPAVSVEEPQEKEKSLEDPTAAKSKAKTKPKSKKRKDDPFESDNDDNDDSKAQTKKRPNQSNSDDEEQPRKKQVKGD
ncbi:hypothetical protein K435DRAFT_713703 [Dendrothele bispora CBS 962.96]|uniref:DUF1917-domain-containing protein n=1 Tax=Dendrothele bispora (strain CBS 962.96) TaxID=1314807 RepID=A0A4S8MR92_DENBC|nr:hypothetical protein K435DRAFT_713703 [Dendrothele bispora CBS 962.96]